MSNVEVPCVGVASGDGGVPTSLRFGLPEVSGRYLQEIVPSAFVVGAEVSVGTNEEEELLAASLVLLSLLKTPVMIVAAMTTTATPRAAAKMPRLRRRRRATTARRSSCFCRWRWAA